MKKKYSLNRIRFKESSFEELFVECPVCNKPLLWKQSVQKGFQDLGIGHKCPSCKNYIGGVVCSNCNSQYLIDDTKWCSITPEKPFVCTECLEPLLPEEGPSFALGMSVVETKDLQAFTDHESEICFIDIMKLHLSKELQDVLSLYHETTFERISLAKKQVDELVNLEIPISLLMSNNKDLQNSPPEYVEEVNNNHHSLIYVFVLSLFSAIESLLHEVNLVCGLGVKEHDVDYKMLKSIPVQFASLQKVCLDFSEHEDFKYLIGLRNLLSHRRLTMLASKVRFDIPNPLPFRPYVIRPSCTYYLPDSPLVEPGNETYNSKKELKKFLDELYNFTCEVKESLYENLFLEINNGH